MGRSNTKRDLSTEFPDGQLDIDGNEVDAENERCRLASRRERPLSGESSDAATVSGSPGLLDEPLFDV